MQKIDYEEMARRLILNGAEAYKEKFILDSMVKAGKLKDDNRNCVTGFTDTFEYAKENKVILEIEEV